MHLAGYAGDMARALRLGYCGAIHDVVIDLRRGSPTHGQWLAHELREDRPTLLYVPPGFAHGYQTLEDETLVYYFMSAAYTPDAERGIRWDDPKFGIDWPIAPPFLSDKDAGHPDFRE